MGATLNPNQDDDKQYYDPNEIVDPTLLMQRRMLSMNPQAFLPQYQMLGNGLVNASGVGSGQTPVAAGTAPAIADWRTRAPAPAAAAARPTTSSGGGSNMASEPSAWDMMSDAEKAAWYAENPTMGKITQTLQDLWGYTMLGALQKQFNPEFVENQGLIARGINPATASRGTGLISQITPETAGVSVNPATGGISVDYGLSNGSDGLGLSVPSYSASNSGVSVNPSTGGISVDYGLANGNDGLGLSVPSYSSGSGGSSYDGGFSVNTGGYSLSDGAPSSGLGLSTGGGLGISAPSVPSYSVESNYSLGSSGGYGGDSGASVSAPGESGWGSDIGADGDDGYSGSSDSSGGGDSGGGGKIVCTAMNEAYGFGSFRNRVWIKYARDHLTKAHEVGYHTIFLPLVKFGYQAGDGTANRFVRKILENIARHRGADLRAEMRGSKRDTVGRIYRMILEPICWAVGKLKGY